MRGHEWRLFRILLFLDPGDLVGGGLIKSYWMRRCRRVRSSAKSSSLRWETFTMMWNNVSNFHITMKMFKWEKFIILRYFQYWCNAIKNVKTWWSSPRSFCTTLYWTLHVHVMYECMNYTTRHICMFMCMRVSMMYGGNVFINQWPQWVPTTFSSKVNYSSLRGLVARILNISQQAQKWKPLGVISSDGVDLRPIKYVLRTVHLLVICINGWCISYGVPKSLIYLKRSTIESWLPLW